jgi:hypothetical protein
MFGVVIWGMAYGYCINRSAWYIFCISINTNPYFSRMSTSSDFTCWSRNVDIFMWDHPDALVLVAGGNTGSDGLGSIGSPATCKNGVAVGASLNSEASWEVFGVSPKTDFYNQNSLAGFSSRGPTYDNRLKPDVCAPGESIMICHGGMTHMIDLGIL